MTEPLHLVDHGRGTSFGRAELMNVSIEEGLNANFRRLLRVLGWRDREWTELQALSVPNGTRYEIPCMVAYARDEATALRLLVEMGRRKPIGIYIILNRINPAVATRYAPGGWQAQKKGASTKDTDIEARRVLFADFDRRNAPTNTSATDAELMAALRAAETFYDDVARAIGRANALALGMSGNGGTVLIALDDLPNSDEVEQLIKGILACIEIIYGTADAKVDSSVCDAKRLGPAFGTQKRKGAEGHPERPHRQTGLLCSDEVERLSYGHLCALFAHLYGKLTAAQRADIDKTMGVKREPPKSAATNGSSNKTSDSDSPFKRANTVPIREVLERLDIDPDHPVCPGCGSGGPGDSSVVIYENGLKCSHGRCSGKGVKKGFRTVIDVVLEKRACSNIEAVNWLAAEFNFEGLRAREKQSSRTNRSAGTTNTANDQWSEPESLSETLLPVARLDLQLIPAPFRPWIADVAHRLQAPPDFVAVGVVVAMASVIGRAIGIRPKLRDDWTVVPNLWGGVIAEPGMFKSPSLKAALTLLHLLVASAIEEHKRAIEKAQTLEPIGEAQIKDLKKRIQAAVESKAGRGRGRLRVVRDDDDPESPDAAGEDPAKLAVELAALQKAGVPPQLRRYIVNDSSVEKLGELLNQNERGLLLFRDELTGFLYKLDSDGHECDRAFYLEAWDGNGQSFTYDRILRGTIRIEAPCVSILGGVQPGPLTAYVRSLWKSGAGDDGLIQRFQLLVWPDVIKECHYIDEWPDTDARKRAYDIFQRAAEPGAAVAVGAYANPGESERIPYLRFAPDAQPLFDGWYQALMIKVRAGDDHPAIRSHLSKYASLMPSLALVFHVIDVMGGAAAAGPITAQSAALAIRWTEYLETHARRVYAAITRRREIAGALLGAKIKAGKIQDGFTLRDVYVKGWAGLTDPEDVKLAVEELTAAGWLQPYDVEGHPVRGGRPTTRFAINPRVRHA